MTHPVLGQHYIGGARSAAGRTTLRSHAAIGGQPHPVAFHEATEAEVDAAVAAAQAAFAPYRALDPARRAAFLEAIAEEVDALGEDFLAEVMRETALPQPRLAGERARTSLQLRLFARVLRRGDCHGARIDTALPERQPLPRPDMRQCKIGVGPVAVFGASNFPLAFSVAGGDTASALAAGCPVVVKAHPGHLVTSERVADAVLRAAVRTGMPDGVFNMVYGDRVGARLVQASGIQAVGFTGSLRGGRALCDLAAARPDPIPVFAEMSSINPIFAMPQALEARAERIAEELAAAVTASCGQLCTNPGLVLGLRSQAFTRFVARLREAMAAQAPQAMLHAGIRASFRQGVAQLAGRPGITLLLAGEDAAHAAHPTLFQADARLLLDAAAPLEDELFGPSTVVVELDSQEQMLAFARQMRGQLTASLLAQPQELAGCRDLIAQLEHKAGRLLINGYPTGLEVGDATVHGGPYPATSDARGTSVGSLAIERFLRPICYQNYPDALLPPALQDANPLGLLRLVNGEPTRAAL